MYYVTMTDRVMSGWGEAKGKINKLIISCYTYDEALIVAQNAKNRSEMKYINIRNAKPYYSSKSHDTQIEYPFECRDCDFCGSEWYNLTFVGYTDENGNDIEPTKKVKT